MPVPNTEGDDGDGCYPNGLWSNSSCSFVKGWETEVDWSETVAKCARRSLVGFQSAGLPCISSNYPNHEWVSCIRSTKDVMESSCPWWLLKDDHFWFLVLRKHHWTWKEVGDEVRGQSYQRMQKCASPTWLCVGFLLTDLGECRAKARQWLGARIRPRTLSRLLFKPIKNLNMCLFSTIDR